MKHTRKILVALLVLMSILMSLAVVAIPASAAPLASGKTLYLKPSDNWKEASAWFTAWFFEGNGADQMVKMTDTNGDGIYEVTIPSGGYKKVIFVRKDPANTGVDWNGNWGQTANLTIPESTSNKICYNVINWNASGSGWTDYTVALAGSFNGWSTTNYMTVSDGIATLTLDLDASSTAYEFKILEMGNWVGNSSTISDSTTSSLVFKGTVSSNCKLKSTGGTYVFTYEIATNKLTVHKHVWSDATCTVPKTCLCGATTGTALGHNLDAGTQTTAPTCTVAGVLTKACSRCSYTETSAIAALNHDIEIDEKVDATCIETGLTEGSHCTRCDHKIAQEVIPATGKHDFSEDNKCSQCGAKELVASGSSDTETKEATITFDASKTQRTEYSTSIQKWENGSLIVTNNKGSSTSNVGDYSNPVRFYKSSEIIIAYPGMTSIVIDANVADSKYSTPWADTLTAVGLSYTEVDGVYTITFSEPVDSITLTTTAQIRANSITAYAEVTVQSGCPHTNYTTNLEPATCTESGKIVIKCDDCGKSTSVDNAKAPALGHDINADHVCNVCGKDDPDYYFEMPITDALVATTGKQVKVSGTVVEIYQVYNESYNNISVYIQDENGVRILLYRLSGNVSLHDVITVEGAIDLYSGVNQIANGTFVLDGKEECTFGDATCTEPAKCAICGTEKGEALGHNYVDDICSRCGDKKPAAGVTTVTVSKTAAEMMGILGLSTANGTGVNGKTINLDGNVSVIFAQAKSGTAPSYYDPAIRLYQGGATLTIKGTGVKTIVITVNSSSGDGPISVVGGTASALTNMKYTITVNEGVSEVVITTTGTDKNSRVYVSNIEVTYEVAAECTHENTTTTTVDATCTEAGSSTVVCDDCGETVSTETIPAPGHTWVAGEVKAPTCTAGGYTNYACACGETKTDDATNATGHVNTTTTTVDSTCKVAGSVTVTCSCGHVVSTETLPLADHTAGEAVEENRVESTCTVAGSYESVVYCSVCKTHEISRNTVDLPLAEHIAGEAVEENRTESTCKVAGSYDNVVYCSVCKTHEISRETKALELAEHTAGEAVKENEKASTCTVAGSYDNVVYCSACGEELSRDTVPVPASGHNNGTPYYEANGEKLYFVTPCTKCDYKNEVLVTEPIDVDNEAYLKQVLYAGFDVRLTANITLTSVISLNGVDVRIDLNGFTITADYDNAEGSVEVILAKNDAKVAIFGDGKMEATGEGNHVQVISSIDGASVVISNGSYISNGCTAIYATRGGSVAINGGYYEAKELYNGMNFLLDVNEKETVLGVITVSGGSFVGFNPANHNNDGANSNKLTAGLHAIKADGVYTVGAHSYNAVVTKPDCENGGYTTHTCVCGDEYKTEATAALGHNMVAGTVVAPTFDTNGYTVYTCDNGCGHTENRDVVPALSAVVMIGTQKYETLAEALEAAKTMSGDVVVEIFDKVTLAQPLTGSFDTISFVGKDTDAEIYLDVQGYVEAAGKKVSFTDLTLSKVAGGYVANAGFMNLAFGIYNTEVTYTNCVFDNGAYASGGKATFDGCTFYRSHDRYGMWVYGDVDCVVENCTFDDIRGIKLYSEGLLTVGELTVKNTDFTKADNKPAIVLTSGKSVTLEGNTYSAKGVFELDLDGVPNGTSVTSDVPPTCVNDNGACGVLVDGKIYTTVAQAAEVATGGSEVVLLHDSTETVEFAKGVNLDKNGFAADGVTVKLPNYVAQVGDTKYESVIEALLAAIDAGATEVKILKSVREKMPTDIELVVNADLLITADEAVELKFYNEGTSYDFIFNSNNYNTITIGENVTFQLEDRVIWLGYYGNNVTVVVNGTLAGYQIWHGADTTVNATGTLKSTGEAFVMRFGATLTVDGGKVEVNYFNILAGKIFAENATITCGAFWIANNGGYEGEGCVSINLWDSTLTSSGNLKSSSAHAAGVSIDFYNSVVEFNDFDGYGACQLDANTTLYVNGENAELTVKNLVNNGTIEIYDGGTVKVNGELTINGNLSSTDNIIGKITAAETATIVISGGTYTQDVSEYCENGKFDCKDNGDGTYSVVVHVHSYEAVVTAPTFEAQGYTTHTCKVCGDFYVDSYVPALVAVAQIGEKKFETLQEAFDAAVNGDTITLVADIAVSKYIDIKTANNGELAREITLDLNGHSIYAADDYKVSDYPLVFVGINQTLTLKNSVSTFSLRAVAPGTIYAPAGVTVGVYGTLNLEGGSILNGGTSEDDAAIAVWNWNNEPGYDGTVIGSATIDGGVVTGGLYNEGNLTVNDGEIDELIVEMGNVEINGGNIGDIEAEASIGSAYYSTLQDAINAADSDDVITLRCDIELDSLVLDKTVTIDGQNLYTMTAAISITANNVHVSLVNLDIVGVAGNAAVITMTANAKLTVSGSITAKGDNQYILLAVGVTSVDAYIDADLTLINDEILKTDAKDIACSFKAEYADELAARGYVTKADGDMIRVEAKLTYYIGTDGYWYFNDEKTDYKAVGTDGDQFTIGDDGYWYLNGVKTEYKAVAKDADQYTIGDDGYWYLNGVKTEYKAIGADGKNYTIVDGEWYLNGEPTGLKAVGTDGDKVEIGEDGYWYINGNKTDYRAKGEDGKTPSFKIENGHLWATFDDPDSSEADWTDLGKVVGKDGVDGLTPEFKVENGKLYVRYDEDDEWEELGEIAGSNGINGLTPEFKVENGKLYVKYGENGDWKDLGTIAGSNGINGLTPEFKVENGKLYVRFGEDGEWNDLGKIAGSDGVDGLTPDFKVENGKLYVKYGENGEWNDLGTIVGSNGINGLTPDFKIENGKLYVKYGENGEWSDLGTVAGQNGMTPSISENGNWIIGGVETNYPAIGKDGKDYTIGEDGYWYVDGEKTEYKAVAVDGKTPTFKIEDGNLFVTYDGENWTDLGRIVGKDGITPHIGENGNWWIGETDTGVSANGNAPYIGENGNWWIGETDTGVQADALIANKEIIICCVGIMALLLITTIVALVTRKYRNRWWILT